MSYNKYKNKKRNGFDSKKEEARYYELLMMQKAGIINGLERQVKFDLNTEEVRRGRTIDIGRQSYTADFTYWRNGEFVVEDVKGYRGGEAYKLFRTKKAWVYQNYRIIIKEI